MPGTPSWSKLATVGLVIFGVFLGCGGVGMGSWAVGAVGVALIAAGVGLLVLPAMKGRAYSYSRGTAHVVNATEPPTSRAPHGRCQLHIVVHSQTINGQSVKIRDNKVPIAKWPDAGANLPILVAINDARRVEILWDEVPSHGSVAEQEARLRDAPTAPLDTAPLDTALIEEGIEEGEEGADYAEGDEGPEFDESPEGPAYAEATEGAGYAGGDEGPAYAGVPVDEGDIPDEGDDGLDGRTRTYAPAQPYDAGGSPEDGSELIPAGASQGRVIELDVMDPSVMRWSSPAAAPGAPLETPRRRPSPRPRPRPPIEVQVEVEEESAARPVPVESMPEWPPPRATAAATDFLAPEAPEAPEVAEPSAPPEEADAGLFDQESPRTVTVPVGDPLDDPAVATAYMNATPPPDEQGRARVRNVALTVFVTDLSRSIIFYRDVLGFTEIDAGHGSTVLESGAARIVLRRVPMPPVERRVVHLLLEVPDVNAAYRDLVDRGVTFVHRPRAVGQYDMMTLWAAALRDPDGHGIALTQWKPTRLN